VNTDRIWEYANKRKGFVTFLILVVVPFLKVLLHYFISPFCQTVKRSLRTNDRETFYELAETTVIKFKAFYFDLVDNSIKKCLDFSEHFGLLFEEQVFLFIPSIVIVILVIWNFSDKIDDLLDEIKNQLKKSIKKIKNHFVVKKVKENLGPIFMVSLIMVVAGNFIIEQFEKRDYKKQSEKERVIERKKTLIERKIFYNALNEAGIDTTEYNLHIDKLDQFYLSYYVLENKENFIFTETQVKQLKESLKKFGREYNKNDIEANFNNKQKYNLNGIEIINPEGYSYNEKKSNKIQLLFDKNDGSELRVMASKIKDRAITSDAIKKVILSGNDIIKWKLLEPLKSSSGDLSELATISYGPNGLSGYRTGFKFNSLLVMIDSYAKTPREAFKALLETSINIDKNNLKYFTSKDIKEMTKNATKDIIQNYLKENPQLLPFSDK